MSARWWTFLVWALVAASALAWGLKVFVRPQPAPPQAQLAEPAGALRGDLTRLFGVDPVPVAAEAPPEPAADDRFDLVGVVSPRSAQAAREGLALIAVDGKPPRAYRVGAVVEGATVLQAVNARGATLGPRDGAPAVNLTLAPPAPAATGTLPPAAARGATAPPLRPGMRPPVASPQPLPVQPSIGVEDGEDNPPPPTASPEPGPGPGNRANLR
jgi:general secretion pathway protein C